MYEVVAGVACIPLDQIDHPRQQNTRTFIDFCNILYPKEIILNEKLTFGVKYAWYLFKIFTTFLIKLGLILVGSINTSSSLNVILDITSLARVHDGAIHPFNIQTIYKTFSTNP